MFLELNGVRFDNPDGVVVAELILGVIEGRGTAQEFAELLRDCDRPHSAGGRPMNPLGGQNEKGRRAAASSRSSNGDQRTTTRVPTLTRS